MTVFAHAQPLGAVTDQEVAARLAALPYELTATVPDALAARFTWHASELLRQMGRSDTPFERGLATLRLALNWRYASLGYVAKLLGLPRAAASDLFQAHGHGRPAGV